MRTARIFFDFVDPAKFAPGSHKDIQVEAPLVHFFHASTAKELYGYVALIEGQSYFLYSHDRSQFDHGKNLSVAISMLEAGEPDQLRCGEAIALRSVGKAILDLP